MSTTAKALLSSAAINRLLHEIPGFDSNEGDLHARFRFDTFRAAFAFMTAIADYAEKVQHHPEWLNVFNRVEVWLATDDADGITSLDADMAREMVRVAQTLGGGPDTKAQD